MINKTLLEEYRDLKNTIKVAEEKLKELSPLVVENMRTEGAAKIKLADGTGVFSIFPRKTWKYSPVVTDMELEVKKIKADEQAKGIAVASEIDVLTFTMPKEGEE